MGELLCGSVQVGLSNAPVQSLDQTRSERRGPTDNAVRGTLRLRSNRRDYSIVAEQHLWPVREA